MTQRWLLLLAVAGCAIDTPDTSSVSSNVESGNRLASNRLASNRLASNRLASNSLSAAALSEGSLIETADGREVFSYIVSCALDGGQSITVEDSAGTSYTFDGQLGLAPAWADRTPTVEERQWVTSCLLSRTNYFGVPVAISMRGAHPMLEASHGELEAFPVQEGTYYGDLFDPDQQSWFACGASTWTEELGEQAKRLCAISEDGSATLCGFTYTGSCETACEGGAPGSACHGGDASWSHAITIFLHDH